MNQGSGRTTRQLRTVVDELACGGITTLYVWPFADSLGYPRDLCAHLFDCAWEHVQQPDRFTLERDNGARIRFVTLGTTPDVLRGHTNLNVVLDHACAENTHSHQRHARAYARWLEACDNYAARYLSREHYTEIRP